MGYNTWVWYPRKTTKYTEIVLTALTNIGTKTLKKESEEKTGILLHLLKGRLQSKYKFVLKAAFLYADIPAKTNFSEKFMF